MTLRIPPFLQDVLGESQTLGELLTIALFGVGLPTLLFIAFPEMTDTLPFWRSAIAFLVIIDIAAGCVTNFTRSTSNHYAARRKERLVFIALHIHLLLVAGVLGIGFWHAVLVWGYTTVGALVVNTLQGHRFQVFTAGTLLATGIAVAVLAIAVPNYFLVISLLFMVKVLFSFAVDHYHPTEMP